MSRTKPTTPRNISDVSSHVAADVRVAQRLERDAAPGVRLRELLREARRDGAELGLRGRRSRRPASAVRRPTAWAPRARGGGLPDRAHRPDAAAPDQPEVLGHDAHDREERAVEPELAADDRRVARRSACASRPRSSPRRSRACSRPRRRTCGRRPALTPSTSKMPAVTHWRDTVSAFPSAPAITMPPTLGVKPATPSKLRLRASQSRRFERRGVVARSPRSSPGSRPGGPGSPNGSGRSSVASTSAKIALLAPMPSASVTTATSGERRRACAAGGTRRSCRVAARRATG